MEERDQELDVSSVNQTSQELAKLALVVPQKSRKQSDSSRSGNKLFLHGLRQNSFYVN